MVGVPRSPLGGARSPVRLVGGVRERDVESVEVREERPPATRAVVVSPSGGLTDRSAERQFTAVGEKAGGSRKRLEGVTRLGDDCGGRARLGSVAGIGVSVGERGESAADIVGSGRRHTATWPRVRI
ncbi:hypothetical protein C458_17890 [Haloferax sp. ATCC BAA-644]|nr:hypothetical protein C460_08445 [Haloferax sp. ATCC BAA-646]ELZ62847.1 hypothetical protein C458_17890 [Haloferax sp. ATCC BAA-644]ELZ64813.1 hypothetical protein C459_09815 [Haloferax sp. ATCC BAA-645]